MIIWRAVYRKFSSQEWRPISNKLYPEKRHATLSMRHASWDAKWDPNEKVWVNQTTNMLYKIQSAEVGEWEDFGV